MSSEQSKPQETPDTPVNPVRGLGLVTVHIPANESVTGKEITFTGPPETVANFEKRHRKPKDIKTTIGTSSSSDPSSPAPQPDTRHRPREPTPPVDPARGLELFVSDRALLASEGGIELIREFARIKQAALCRLNGVSKEVAKGLMCLKVSEIFMATLSEYQLKLALRELCGVHEEARVTSICKQDRSSVIAFLITIPEVSPATAKAVYKSYKPFTEIFGAPIAELEQIKKSDGNKINARAAFYIYHIMHS